MECLRISLMHICAKYRQTKLRGSESPTAVLPATALGMGSQSYSILVLATTEQTCGWRFSFFPFLSFFFLLSHLSLCFPCLLLLKRKNTHGLLWDWNEMNWRQHALCNVQLYFLFDIVFWFFLMRKEEKLCTRRRSVCTRWYNANLWQTEGTRICQ